MGPLPLAGRVGEGVVQCLTDGPPPSVPPLKGEGGEGAENVVPTLHEVSTEPAESSQVT